MRIAELATRFPPGPGGVERHVEEIARRFARRGDDVTVLTSDLYREFPWQRLAPDVPRTERRDGVTVRRLGVWSLPGELHYPFFRGLGAALAETRPDVVHAHTYGTYQAAVARRFGRRSGTPYVLTAHYHPIWSIEGGWFRHRLRGFYDRALAGPIVRDAACVIVQTREEERLLRAPGISLPRVEIVPPGYTPLPSPPAGDRPFAAAFGIGGPYLLFVGRLASNKGLLPLVAAFERLARHDVTSRLVLVGEDGGMRSRVEEEVRRRGLTDRVHLTGFVGDERLLASAFREARLSVLPSEYEAFGLVLLESLAQGTPVVASRVGGIPEFVPDGEAGRLVPPADAAALGAALVDLWDDEATRRRMGAFGRDRVVPLYTWDRLVERLRTIFEEVTRR